METLYGKSRTMEGGIRVFVCMIPREP